MNGDNVDLVSDKGRFVARGIYNARSRIRVRLYAWSPQETLDETFWRHRLQAAIDLRRLLGYDDPEEAARLVFSEGDGLSGLIVDRFGEYLIVQVTALAMQSRLKLIVPLLAELVEPRAILVRTERAMAKSEGMEVRDGVLWGEAPGEPVVIFDRGMRYRVDLAEGQKTGFYLDQRENRYAVAPTCAVAVCSTCSATAAASAWPPPFGAALNSASDSTPATRQSNWPRPTPRSTDSRMLSSEPARDSTFSSTSFPPESGSEAWSSIRPSSPEPGGRSTKPCAPIIG